MMTTSGGGAGAGNGEAGEGENSHAEGVDGAAGPVIAAAARGSNSSSSNNNNNNPHYENIYESVDHVRGGEVVGHHHHHHPLVAGVAAVSGAVGGGNKSSLNRMTPHRIAGYDMVRNRTNTNTTTTRRANLHLDLSANGPANSGVRGRYQQLPIYAPLGSAASTLSSGGQLYSRQHSFDDTESAHYHQVLNNNTSNYCRYENLYEQIHEEPIYRNVVPGGGGGAGGVGGAAGSRVYGRLDVIGHGIGRIERHLSSSCGNIDHYNVGGNYAGAVGHIRMNSSSKGASAAAPSSADNCQASKDSNVKSYSSFFNCLSKENSQSMMNMDQRSAGTSGGEGKEQDGGGGGGIAGQPVQGTVGGVEKLPAQKQTGAIPKVATNGGQVPAPIASGSTTTIGGGCVENSSSSMSLNKITKSSMQWLMMNKWLPMWMGQGSDCRVIDFNFMFSRKCDCCSEGDNCGHAVTNGDNDEELLQTFAAANDGRHVFRNYGQPAQFWTPHPTHRTLSGQNGWNDGRWSLRREQSADQRHYDVPRATMGRFGRGRSKPASPNLHAQRHFNGSPDPFRNWELNVENNTFKPANNRVQDVRRITDGTYRRKEMKEPRDASRIGQPSSLATTSSLQQQPMPVLGKFKFMSSSTVEVKEEEKMKGNSESSEDSSGTSTSSISMSSGSGPVDVLVDNVQVVDHEEMIVEQENEEGESTDEIVDATKEISRNEKSDEENNGVTDQDDSEEAEENGAAGVAPKVEDDQK